MKYLAAFLLICTSTLAAQWTGLIASELALATMTESIERVPRSKCTACKGTGQVKAGDGQTVVWRTCDRCFDDTGQSPFCKCCTCENCTCENCECCKCENCECGAHDETEQDETLNEPENEPVPGQRILFFTASWCIPCQRVKRDQFPAMIRAGWRITDVEKADRNTHVCVIDIDQHSDVGDKFGVETLPTFIVIVDGREQLRHTGYLDSRGIRKLWDDAKNQSGDG